MKLALLLGSIALGCGSKGHPPPPLGEDLSFDGGGGRNGRGNGGTGGGAGSAGSTSTAGAAGSLGASGASGAGGGVPGFEPPSCIPRQACRSYCGAFGTDPSACGLGSAQECGCICEQRFNGPCPDELQALLACTGSAPDVECATRGRIVGGCESESVALELCDFRAREQLCAQSYPRCLAYCQPAALSSCPQGPRSVTSCLCGCEATLVTRCEVQFNAFMACTADAPAFSCDADGRNVASSCTSEWQALDSCIYQRPDAGN